jgi:hypothetical protein
MRPRFTRSRTEAVEGRGEPRRPNKLFSLRDAIRLERKRPFVDDIQNKYLWFATFHERLFACPSGSIKLAIESRSSSAAVNEMAN